MNILIKTFFIYFCIQFLGHFCFSQSNQIPLIDESGKLKLTSSMGIKIAFIEIDGMIRDINGKEIGKIIPTHSGTYALNHRKRKVGETLLNGNFMNKKGEIIYRISSPNPVGICSLTNNEGKIVGYIHENYKLQGACAIYAVTSSIIKN